MPQSDQHRLGFFWRKYLHWEWPQFHGQGHRRSAKSSYTELSWLCIQIYAPVHAPDAVDCVVAVFQHINLEIYEQHEIEIPANYEESETDPVGVHSGNGLRSNSRRLRNGFV